MAIAENSEPLPAYILIALTANGIIWSPDMAVPIAMFVFFVGALFQEFGWMGYAYSPMEGKWDAFKATLVPYLPPPFFIWCTTLATLHCR